MSDPIPKDKLAMARRLVGRAAVENEDDPREAVRAITDALDIVLDELDGYRARKEKGITMTRDEYLKRLSEGKPIESFRELVHALSDLQRERIPAQSAEWYAMNRWIRLCMEEADHVEQRGF